MKRSYLEKVYFKKETPDSYQQNFKNKRITAADLQKLAEKIFQNLNPKRISDDNFFWKNIRVFSFSNKVTLVDNKENTIFDDHLVSEELTKFFENATIELEIN